LSETQSRRGRQGEICFSDIVVDTGPGPKDLAPWAAGSAAASLPNKLIGDEAMIVFEEPTRACRVGLDLIDVSEHPVRIGVAHSTVVSLYGDYYGETVNLAARLVNRADPSTLLASELVRNRAGRGFAFEALEPLSLKGFADSVPVFQAGRTTGSSSG
jgi:class 3 adenylate cyclase